MITKLRRIDPAFAAVWVIVRAFLLGAVGFSFSHVITSAHKLGLYGVEAAASPFFIDGIWMLAMIGRGERFSAECRSACTKVAVGMGLLSLAANVFAGQNVGQRGFGVLVVGGFLLCEWLAKKIRPAAPAKPEPKVVDPILSERAKRAAATKAKKKAEAAKAERAADRELRRMAGGERPANAPVSPAIV